MLKIGSVTGIFRWKYSLSDAIKRLADIGYDGIEIWADRPHGWPRDFDKAKRRELRELVRSYGTEISSLCPFFGDLNFASMNPGIRQETVKQTKEAIEMARDLEAKVVLVVPGRLFVPGVPPPDKVWNYAVKDLQECAKYAEDNGIVLGLENVYETYFVVTADDMLRMIKDVGSDYLRAIPDVANINPISSPMGFIEKLKEYIVEVHLSDNDGSAAAHLPLGKGTIDFDALVKKLKESGYDGYLMLEVFFEEDPDNAAIESKKMLESIVAKHSG